MMVAKKAIDMLDLEIRKIIEKRGWTSLTPIQEKAIPEILAGNNVLIMAPTGEGKTEAALLPILSMIKREGAKPISMIYVTPMKALINDLYHRISWWADQLGLVVARKHGDTSSIERSRRLKQVPHILIITPESLEIDLDWAHKIRKYYRNLRWVVVDEAHELLSGKRGAQFVIQLERLAKLAGRDIQRIALSATIGNPTKAVELLSGSSRRPKKIVRSESSKRPELRIVYVKDTTGDIWLEASNKILEEIEKPSLVFVNSRYVAERIKDALEKLGADDVYVHHSSVSTELRLEAESKLRQGELSAVVCTKTLEVGIDVGKIKRVIQIKAPGRVSSLLQRIGRSGHRIGENPKGTIIALGELDLIESVATGVMAVKGALEDTVISRVPLDVIAKEIQGILLERGEASREELYHMIVSHPKINVSLEEYEELIDYLMGQGIIREKENGMIRLGSTFYKIWKFRGDSYTRAWWSRDFSEFFSTISDRDSFIVRHRDKTIGYIDSIFVYKHLRTGDTIRLAGRAWYVKRIDENLAKIEVEPASDHGEVPLWRGEGPKRARELAKTMIEILSGKQSIEDIELDSSAKKIIKKWIEYYSSKLGVENLESSIIYETYGREKIITAPLGSGASETLALIVTHIASREIGLNVYYRSMFMGFSVSIGELNPIDILMELDLNEFDEILDAALEKSPYLYQTIRDIQLSFGKIGSTDSEEDELLYREAKRQILENYLDVEGAKEFIKRLQGGELKVRTPYVSGITPIARQILLAPPIKPWIPDLAGRIARLLEGSAFTIFELTDILDLSEKTIESKIKDMRKEEYGEKRVVGFIDIDEDEWRWTLYKSLEEIVNSEEFENSFKPSRLDEPMRVYVKNDQGHRVREIIVTPRLLLENWERLEEVLPQNIYYVRVISAYGYGGRDDISVTHYHVPLKALRYLLLNAAAYLQSKNAGYYW